MIQLLSFIRLFSWHEIRFLLRPMKLSCPDFRPQIVAPAHERSRYFKSSTQTTVLKTKKGAGKAVYRDLSGGPGEIGGAQGMLVANRRKGTCLIWDCGWALSLSYRYRRRRRLDGKMDGEGVGT